MREKVLLTGANGLLGRNLLKWLLSESFELYALVRNNADMRGVSRDSRINWIYIKSFEEVEKRISSLSFEYVIHTAALVSYRKSDRRNLFKVNVDYTKILLESCLQNNKLKKFVFISSISTLGQKDNPITEDTQFNEEHFITNYGRSKREAEMLVKHFGLKTNLPYVILNPSVIIGPAPVDQSSASLFGYVLKSSPFYTNGQINYVDVDDVSKVILKLMKSTIAKEQYIINAGSISYKDFFKAIAKTLGKRPPYIRVSPKLVYAAVIFENLWSFVQRKPATLSMETAKMANKNNRFSSEKLRVSLVHKFNSYEYAIQKTVKELKAAELIN